MQTPKSVLHNSFKIRSKNEFRYQTKTCRLHSIQTLGDQENPMKQIATIQKYKIDSSLIIYKVLQK